MVADSEEHSEKRECQSMTTIVVTFGRRLGQHTIDWQLVIYLNQCIFGMRHIVAPRLENAAYEYGDKR
jgi:lipid-A-disaccharide synthase-like uncharacterized protein